MQDSAALNGTQRVLLDQVMTEEECSALKHLAHVRTPPSPVGFLASCFIYQLKRVSPPPRLSGRDGGGRRLQREDVSTHPQRKV